jgi:hypothetical protein
MKDEYKIIKSISIFPWNRFEVWVRGEVSKYPTSEYHLPYDHRKNYKEVETRCVHSTHTEQKAQEWINYWENVSEFKLGESNETI